MIMLTSLYGHFGEDNETDLVEEQQTDDFEDFSVD